MTRNCANKEVELKMWEDKKRTLRILDKYIRILLYLHFFTSRTAIYEILY